MSPGYNCPALEMKKSGLTSYCPHSALKEKYSPDARLGNLEAISIAMDGTICRGRITEKLLDFAFDRKSHDRAGAWMDAARDAFGRMWHEE